MVKNSIGDIMTKLNIKSQAIGVGLTTEETNTIDINENWIVSGVYPIGSLYFNINNIDPSTYFGGTWERYGKGRVLVGVNPSDSNFSTVNKTGGSATHTLTSAQMPQHSHQISAGVDSVASTTSGVGFPRSNSDSITDHAFASNSIGSGGAHNNLMPFATCYIWKRIA